MKRSAYSFEAEKLQDPAWSSLRRLLWIGFNIVNEIVLAQVKAQGFQDIRPPHATAFRCMETEGVRVITLAERAGVTKQAMSLVVKEMVEMGYVKTEQDSTDKRALLVKRTEKGDRLMKAFIAAD